MKRLYLLRNTCLKVVRFPPPFLDQFQTGVDNPKRIFGVVSVLLLMKASQAKADTPAVPFESSQTKRHRRLGPGVLRMLRKLKIVFCVFFLVTVSRTAEAGGMSQPLLNLVE